MIQSKVTWQGFSEVRLCPGPWVDSRPPRITGDNALATWSASPRTYQVRGTGYARRSMQRMPCTEYFGHRSITLGIANTLDLPDPRAQPVLDYSADKCHAIGEKAFYHRARTRMLGLPCMRINWAESFAFTELYLAMVSIFFFGNYTPYTHRKFHFSEVHA